MILHNSLTAANNNANLPYKHSKNISHQFFLSNVHRAICFTFNTAITKRFRISVNILIVRLFLSRVVRSERSRKCLTFPGHLAIILEVSRVDKVRINYGFNIDLEEIDDEEVTYVVNWAVFTVTKSLEQLENSK